MNHWKHAVDAGSVLTAFASLFDLMPSVAALVSAIWGLLRIYETRTVQRWLYPNRRLLTRKSDGDTIAQRENQQ